jgi:hypothetical protein
MKIANKILLVLFIMIAISVISCNASRKNKCGCPNKQGMVGY